MNKIISRMLVFGLLYSFVQAQEPSRDIDKEEAKNVSAQQKGKSADKDKASRDANMPDGVTSDYEQKHETVAKTGPKSATTGKLGPGGSSARVSSADELPGTTYNATQKRHKERAFLEDFSAGENQLVKNQLLVNHKLVKDLAKKKVIKANLDQE